MLIDYLLNNIDVFRRFTNKTEEEFFDYIECMKNTEGTNADDIRHWADQDMVTAMSSFLKTPIVCYKPQEFDDGERNVWYTIDGVTWIAGMTYDSNFVHFNETNKQIVLNNLSEHFEPAEL